MSKIDRHKTAIRRTTLSKPVQLLVKSGLVSRDTTFLDYGCGLGDDVRILTENGFPAEGWDPSYFPQNGLKPASIVNVGYVINVIEDIDERKAVIKRAFDLAETVLCVAALYDTPANRPNGLPYRDGVLTARGTFQRLYRQEELIDLVKGCTELNPTAGGPGICLVFKDEKTRSQYDFSVSRRVYKPVSLRLHTAAPRSQVLAQLTSDFEHEWSAYKTFVMESGRPPDDFECSFNSKARSRQINPEDVFCAAIDEIGREEYHTIRDQRRDDLLVFLATRHFGRAPRMADLPRTMQLDIRYHFGSLKQGLTIGMGLLTECAQPDKRRQAAAKLRYKTALEDGLFCLSRDVPGLPVHLRAFVALGSLFFGSYREALVIKIHFASNKITFFEPDENNNDILFGYKVNFENRKMDVYAIDGAKIPLALP